MTTIKALQRFFRVCAYGLVLACTTHTLTANAQAADTPQIPVDFTTLRAIDSLAHLSQSLGKNYFYVNNELNTNMARRQIKQDTAHLRSSLEVIKEASVKYKKDDINETLDFLDLVIADYDAALSEDFSIDNALLVMNMGDVILEATQKIKVAFPSPPNTKAAMIDLLNTESFLIERLTKLYIASLSGIDEQNTKPQIDMAIATFEGIMAKLQTLDTAPDYLNTLAALQKRWNRTKQFYAKAEHAEMPQTVFYSSALMDRHIHKLLALNEEELSQ